MASMTQCISCGFDRRLHKNLKCNYFAPSMDMVPVTCPYGCGAQVSRIDLEAHARNAHGATRRAKPQRDPAVQQPLFEL